MLCLFCANFVPCNFLCISVNAQHPYNGENLHNPFFIWIKNCSGPEFVIVSQFYDQDRAEIWELWNGNAVDRTAMLIRFFSFFK